MVTSSRFRPCIVALLACVACGPSPTSSAVQAPGDQRAAVTIDPASETAEPATAPVAEPKPDPVAELKKKLEAALKELEDKAAAETQRWTPELEALAVKLTATQWRKASHALKTALSAPYRMPGHAQRDAFRHPVETMEFFGLTPKMHVFEAGPGQGWWTELLAVILGAQGQLVVATYDPDSEDPRTGYFGHSVELLLGKSDGLYGAVHRVLNADLGSHDMGPPDSLDMVLAMRVAHNLVRAGQLQAFLGHAYRSLKPGGILAIEQHRAVPGADPATSANTGYLPEAWLIEQVEAAGFRLEKKSEINANPRDTKDYPKGVWTLPPVYAEGEKDRAKYEAIGESDRMTLKFVKVVGPVTPTEAPTTNSR